MRRRSKARPSLSVICGAHRSGAQVAAAIGPLREVADEIIIGADDRVSESDLAWYGSVADTLVTYPFVGPVRHRGLLREQASGDWLLVFDDDEIPSQALLEAIPQLIRDQSIASYHLAIWWLDPAGSGILDDRPWSWSASGYLGRLVRNDDRLWFPSRKHTGAQTSGASKRLDLGIIHLALALDDLESRQAKVDRYDSQQFGLLTEGRPTNEAYYLPEALDVPPRVRPLEPIDQRRVTDALLASGPPPRRHRPVSLRATEDDIRRTVPWTPFSDADAQAAITVRHHPTSVPAGTVFEVDVQVANLGGRVWPSGPDQEPKIRLSYHWFHGSEAVVFEGRRTLLPHPLAPNDATMMTCVVEAPDDYRSDARWALAFEVLTEGDRWFGIAASIDIEVSAGPRQRLLEAATESYVPLDEVMSLRRELAFVDPLSSFMDHHGVQDDPPVYHRTLFEAVAIEASTTEGAALGEIVRRYEADQPAHVLEFGSGSSTVLLAALAQRAERQGRTIVSVANNADEAERVRGLLRDRGLESFVQLIVAPIVEVDEGGLNLSCFDPEVIAAGLAERSPDLVVVKGPADVGGASRFPTLLIAQEHIEKSATFLVQDAWRDKELAAAERWSKCPGIQVDGIIPLPRGMLVGTIEPIP